MLTLIFMILLYFLPSIIARGKRDATGIFLLNLFLGWTFIGWLIALIWACTAEPTYIRPRMVPVPAGGRFCCQCGTFCLSRSPFLHLMWSHGLIL